MPHNAAAHITSFDRALEGEYKNLDQLGATIGFELARRTIDRTPKDDGVLVNNWNLSVGSPDETVRPDPDASGSGSLSRASEALKTYSWGKRIWLTNNLPYAAVWEFGTFVPPDPGPSKDPRPDRKGKILVSGGFSLQAPQGMLGISQQEIENEFGF